jgi:hypothetical protein
VPVILIDTCVVRVRAILMSGFNYQCWAGGVLVSEGAVCIVAVPEQDLVYSFIGGSGCLGLRVHYPPSTTTQQYSLAYRFRHVYVYHAQQRDWLAV